MRHPSCLCGYNTWLRAQRYALLLVCKSLAPIYDHKDTQIEYREPHMYLQKCLIFPANWLHNPAGPMARASDLAQGSMDEMG